MEVGGGMMSMCTSTTRQCGNWQQNLSNKGHLEKVALVVAFL